VKVIKNSMKLGKCSKLAPRFWGPFEMLACIVPVAYQLELLTNLKVHNIFHILLIKKYVHEPTHVIDWNLL
jgi:hypothetical protein